jgi:hypothetical protein
MLVLIIDAMLFLQTGISGWATCRVSPWSASLFRSNQTAVEAGNGGRLKKLMGENNNKSSLRLSNFFGSAR